MEDFVAFLQFELEKNFGASDDDVIESLRVCEDELRRAKLLSPKPPADDREAPHKPFGLFVPPSVERAIGRPTLDHSPDLIDRRRRSPRDANPPKPKQVTTAQLEVAPAAAKENQVAPLSAPVSDATVQVRQTRSRDDASRRRRRGSRHRPPSSGQDAAVASNPSDEVFISPTQSPHRLQVNGDEASAQMRSEPRARVSSASGNKQYLREFEALRQHMNIVNDEARTIEVRQKRSSKSSSKQRASSSALRDSRSQSSDYDNLNVNGDSSVALQTFHSNDGVTRLHVTSDGNSRMRRSKSDHASTSSNSQPRQQTKTPTGFRSGRSENALQNGVHASNTSNAQVNGSRSTAAVGRRDYGAF